MTGNIIDYSIHLEKGHSDPTLLLGIDDKHCLKYLLIVAVSHYVDSAEYIPLSNPCDLCMSLKWTTNI